MAARPLWKGQIRLSLVAIPVEMYAATRAGARISFRQIHEPSGQPIRYEKVVPGIGPVDRDEVLKGYEVGKGRYVLLTDEEFEDVRLETRKTFELTQFVGACEIDPIYFDKPHFLVPQDELAEDAFRVLRDALRATKRTGLGQLALHGREYLAALKPCDTGLLLETLHYEDEIRKTDAFFSSISNRPAQADLLEVAKELIARETKGRKGRTVETREEGGRGGGEIVDLMSTLKASLEKADGTKSLSKGRTRTTRPANGRRKQSA